MIGQMLPCPPCPLLTQWSPTIWWTDLVRAGEASHKSQVTICVEITVLNSTERGREGGDLLLGRDASIVRRRILDPIASAFGKRMLARARPYLDCHPKIEPRP